MLNTLLDVATVSVGYKYAVAIGWAAGIALVGYMAIGG